MNKLLVIIATLALTGCAAPVQLLAKIYDGADDCQRTELIQTGQYPKYCGASTQGKAYVTRDYYTNRPLTTTRSTNGQNYQIPVKP